MKRLTLLVLALVGSLCGHSQDEPCYPKNQIAIAYGAPSPYIILTWLNNLEGGFFSYYSGIFSVQYMRTINKKVELGVLINHERWGENNTYWPNDEIWRLLSVMQFNCFNKEKIRLYAKWGLGVSYFRCPDYIPRGGSLDGYGSDYWVLPCLDGKVGVELGSGFLRLFSEDGFGAQGIASIGIRSRF
jgi:hypothetical protein